MISIIKDKRFKNVLKFLMAYRFIMQLLITPAILFVGKKVMNFYNIQFMSVDSVKFLLTKPLVWIFILFSLVMLMFLLVFELSSTIVLSQYEDVEASLIPTTFNKIKWSLRLRNLYFLPLIMVVILGFHFSSTTIITDKFFIPEFIMDTINKTPAYLIIYTIVIVLAFIIAFHLVFLFHNLFIGEYEFKDSIKHSVSNIRKNRLDFIYSALKLSIKVSIVFLLTYVTSLFLLSIIIYLVYPVLSFNAVSLTVLFIFNKIIVFALINSVTAVNVMFLTKKYNEYGGMVKKVNVEKISKYSFYPKRVLLALMVFTLIFQGVSAYQMSATFDNPEFLEHKTYITSHRGNSSQAPENTIASIKAAKRERADAAEIDVQLSKDNEVVVIHDFNLSRLANDKRRVIDLTLKQLKQLDVGSWFSKEFKNERIPTLDEVIKESKNEIKLNIELKPTNDEKELAQAVIKVIEENDFVEQSVISSLNKEAIKIVIEIKPEIDVGYILPIALGQFEFEEKIDFYSLEMSFVTTNLVEKLKNQDKEVHVWTVNSEKDLKKMQRLQVDNVITDDPILAKKVMSTNILEKGILEVLTFFDQR